MPTGAHSATWDEVAARHGYNAQRTDLLAALAKAKAALRAAGATEMLLNGSFVTSKAVPGDYDACYVIDDADLARLPAGLDAAAMIHPRSGMKAMHLGDLFPAQVYAVMRPSRITYRDFFKRDRAGSPKGIVHIDMRSRP